MRAVIVSLVGIALYGSVMAAQSASDLAKGDAANGKTIYAERKCGTCHRTDKADDKGGKMSDRHGGHGGEAVQAAGREDVGVHQESEAGADRVRRRQSRRVSEDAAGQILMATRQGPFRDNRAGSAIRASTWCRSSRMSTRCS